MVAWLDKVINLSSSIRAEVSSPESPKKETTQLGFVGMGSRTRTQRSSCITLALYRRRAFRKKVRAGTVLRRAFDKAVRRKPPVVAADAGPMQIQWREGAVSRCTGAVRQSTTDDTGR